MKKLIVLLCFSTFAFTAFSQAYLGFKIGGNFDYLEFVKTDKSDEKRAPVKLVGPHFGLAFDIPLYEDIISFSPELQFSGKLAIDEAYESFFGELQLPLLFSCYITPNFGVDLGPMASYEILNFIKLGDDWRKGDSAAEDLDFGVAGGIRFKIGDNAMVLARYYFGLRKVFELELPMDGFSTYKRSIQISYIYSGGGRGY